MIKDRIQSKQNDKYKSWLSLHTSKGILKTDSYIVSGEKILDEYLQKHTTSIICQLTFTESDDIDNIPTYILSKDLLKDLSPNQKAERLFITKAPLIKPLPSFDELKGPSLLLPLGDPNNLGAVLRSALAFYFKNIILLKEACHPLLPKSVKAASGSIPYLNFFKGPSIFDLDKYAASIYTLDMQGQNIQDIKTGSDTLLLVGEEGPGVPNLPWKKVSIKMNENTESLNASIAASIAMYEFSKTMK